MTVPSDAKAGAHASEHEHYKRALAMLAEITAALGMPPCASYAEVLATIRALQRGSASGQSDLYLCPVCDEVIEEDAGVDPTCPNGPHVNVVCPRHGERTIDLNEVGANVEEVTMCPDCRVVGPDGRPLGWKDGRPSEYVDISAMYRTGTPASDRLVAETRALAATDTFDAEARTWQLAHDHRAMGSAVKADALERVLAELAALRARIDAVRKLHHEGVDSARGELVGDGECVECDQSWPCPTIRGLHGPATGE